MAEIFHGLSRRDFLKFCAGTAAALGLSEIFTADKIAQALQAAAGKPPVIWLEGQDCAGCTISLISIENPSPASLILDKISIRYHETIMAASGRIAEEAREEAIRQGGYLLVVEGSIPGADDRFCMVGGRPFREIVKETADRAAAIVAVGACAAFGGIPKGTPTKGLPVSKILPGKTVINLSTCPVHMDHLMGTIVYFLVTHKAPPLDKLGRPLMYFGTSVHDNCRRRAHFDEEEFLTDWNDPKQKEWCLLEKGCKGPETYSDCPIRRWNNGISFCIDAGAPCQGCSEPEFYVEQSPLYAMGPVTDRILAKKAAGLIPRKDNA
ncbi:MAG: hydrogenase small subunit [Deltaproteobacteria bacterium]|nr:hydrogenase small subunit [Deltaproteobacteria bacterium]MBW2121752.1 hydrogenase small subunit [Deltaproteobacteria bacterium]